VFSAIGLDVVVAAVTATWFIVAGITKLRAPSSAGRRSMPVAGWVRVARLIRGSLELLIALVVLAIAVGSVVGLRFPAIGLWLGLVLSGSSLWTAVESFRPPLRPVRIILAVLGFALAVFFTGFRG
jgi:hypothetical protein